MAWTTGTATNYLDLMTKLKEYVTNAAVHGVQTWTVKRDVVNADTTRELILMGPGLTGNDQIYVGMKSFFNVSGNYYNWVLNGFVDYNSSLPFEEQPGAFLSTNFPPQIPLWNNSITYWFFVNGRRIICICKIGTYYEAAYLGLITPYGATGQYPYPLCIGGSITGKATASLASCNAYRYSITTGDHCHFVNPCMYTYITESFTVESYPSLTLGGTQLMIRKGDGQWRTFVNRISDYPLSYRGTCAVTWPFNMSLPTVNIYSVSSSTATSPLTYVGLNGDGTYPLYPIMLMDSTPNLYGELDGCFWLPGVGLGPESTVTVDGSTYFVVQNVFRTTQEDYWCIRMD